MTRITITIPGPPRSWKRREVSSKTGRSYNPRKYELAKREIAIHLRAAMGRDGSEFWKSQRIKLEVVAYFGTRRTQDPDRVLNLILDAGKGIVWTDDTWTTFEGGGQHIVPLYDKTRPRTEIVITALGEKKVRE